MFQNQTEVDKSADRMLRIHYRGSRKECKASVEKRPEVMSKAVVLCLAGDGNVTLADCRKNGSVPVKNGEFWIFNKMYVTSSGTAVIMNALQPEDVNPHL